MKITLAFALSCLILVSCGTKSQQEEPKQTSLPIIGTWQLISGTLIEKGDTTVTYYTKDRSFIKIINGSHFAFLNHDLNKGKDSLASFGAGGGHYSLKDSTYTEHLEYCNEREWEGHDFEFTVTIKNDTLVQSGIEKVENAGVNRLNIEKYVRVKN
jgi:Lipocalin-like domain